jgi:glycine betaine/choline ABC-type transport system substrate-binding protein
MREQMLNKHPEVKQIVDELTGKITEEDMRQLNYAIDGQHRNVTEIVSEFLKKKNLK